MCGSTTHDLVLKSTYSGSAIEAPAFFLAQRKVVAHGRIVRCRDCAFTFTDPQFEPEDYDQIYREAIQLTPDYSGLSVAERYRGRRLAALLKTYRTNGRLLDFGCGGGGFLSSIVGFDKIGFELVAAQEHKTIGAPIYTGDFLGMVAHGSFKPNTFDVVTAFDVFEHLPDLWRYIDTLTLLIRQGGLLVVTVPNIESFTAKLSGRYWNSFLLEHLWYFSPDTLKRFVEGFGYRRIGTGGLSYDVPIDHLYRRASQTYHLPFYKCFGWLNRVVLPIPVGLMYGVFLKII